MKNQAVSLTSTHPLLSDRVRLMIMASLSSSRQPQEFTYLVGALNLTKGNLSGHLQKLEEAKLILVHKEFVDRKPRTTYICTEQGRTELLTYLESVEALLKKAKAGPK